MRVVRIGEQTRNRIEGITGRTGHHVDDFEDARAILVAARGIENTLLELQSGGVTDHRRSVVEGRLAKRALREIVGYLWEAPRRRGRGGIVRNGKYALGGLWSPGAADLFFDRAMATEQPRDRWNGHLVLEHVVPAAVVTDILLQRAGLDETGPGEVAQLLRDLSTQVVVTRAEDRVIPRFMGRDDELAIRQHFTGEKPLTRDELFAHKWSRYLDAREQLGFGLEQLRVLSGSEEADAGDIAGASAHSPGKL